jgi:uroporphyrinogen decarboxylase
MTCRERVIRSIRFENPDRVPVIHRIKPGYYRRHKKKITDLAAKYPSDILQSQHTSSWFTFYSEGWFGTKPGKTKKDEWGCVWASTTEDHAGQVVQSPITSWNDLKNYQPPEPRYGIEGLREMAYVQRLDGKQHYIVVWIGSIFHTYTYLRSAENALIDMAEQKPEFFSLLDQLTDFLLRRIEILREYDVDGIFLSDDWGSQESTLIDPEQWRRIFKPRYARLADAIHYNGCFAHFHSCGYTLPILRDLIDCGFDVINPQVPVMDKNEVAQIVRGRVCIRPDLDRQGVLIRGNTREVEDHVRDTFYSLKSPGGGYIGQIPVEMNTPLENVEAMMRTYSELYFN